MFRTCEGEGAVVSTRMRAARADVLRALELAGVTRGHQRSSEVIRGHCCVPWSWQRKLSHGSLCSVLWKWPSPSHIVMVCEAKYGRCPCVSATS